MNGKHLKLKAKDAEDIQVISAVLQDAIAPVYDMVYQPEDKSFIMVVHRLRTEVETKDGLERICCAVHTRGVAQAQLQNIDLGQQGRMLDLLAVLCEGNLLTFIFAGDAKIRLTLTDWTLHIEDFGEAWPSHCKPCHDKAVPSA